MVPSKVSPQSTQPSAPSDRKQSNHGQGRKSFPYLLSLLITVLELPFRYLFGRDVFISYSRSDGSKYAPNLALALQAKRPKLSFYLDRWIAPASGKLPRSLMRHLRWSSLLVVVCTENAIKSEFVKDEISSFAKLKRKVIPINVNGAFDKVDREAPPWSEISGASMERESGDAFSSGQPSEDVINRILKSLDFTAQDRRLRRAVWSTLTFVILSIGGASVFSYLAVVKADAANERALEADGRALAAGREVTLAQGWLAEANDKRAAAELDASEAKTRAASEQDKARVASGQAEIANNLRDIAETRAAAARKQALQARERADIATEQEQGSSAAIMAREPGQEFEALVKVAPAAASNFKRRYPDTQVVDGLTGSVMATDYSLPLNIKAWNDQKVQLSPDGSLLFVESLKDASEENLSRESKWEVVNLGEAKPPQGLEGLSFVKSASFSRNNKRVAVVNSYSQVRVWDLTEAGSQPTKRDDVDFAALDDTGERLAMIKSTGIKSLAQPESIIVENLVTGVRDVHVVDKGLSAAGIAFMPGGEVLLQARQWNAPGTATPTAKLLIYSRLAEGVPLGEVNVGVGRMAGVSDDGSLVLISSNTNTIFWLDIKTKRLRRRASGYKGPVKSVTLDTNERVVLSYAGMLNITDARSHPNFYALRGHGREISNIVFSPDGELIATSSVSTSATSSLSTSSQNRINIWSKKSGELLQFLEAPKAPKAFAFSNDNSRLLVINQGGDTSVKIWNIDTGKLVTTSCGAKSISGLGIPLATSFLHDDKYAASAHHGGLLVIWNASNCLPLKMVALDYERLWQVDGRKFERENFTKALFAANGTTLVTQHLVTDYSLKQEKLEVHLWDLNAIDLSSPNVTNGKSPSDNAPRIASKVPSIDSPGWLLAATLHGEIQLLFQHKSGELQITGSDGSRKVRLESDLSVNHASFSRDGQRVLARGERSQKMRVWNAKDGQPLLSLNFPKVFTKTVIAPDGQSFATGGTDGTVRVYPTTPKGFLDVASQLSSKILD